MYTANQIIEALIKDANLSYEYYKKEFDVYDNSDDMHAMNGWKETIGWLELYKEEYYDWPCRFDQCLQ